ncbi:MAG TPA: maleylpyruvate isomerase family mycothiol-dependent enzyme [Streptosporangiaceae bacterium]
MDDALAAAFMDASGYLVEVVRLVPDDSWDQPGLGTWTRRELAGHANRSHTLLEEYLLRPQPPQPPGSPYFSAAAIAARGRDAVAALGADPAAAIAAASAAAIALVAATAPDAALGSPAGTMTLAAYLPSRIAELTIHALDLAGALGTNLAPPPAALRESLAFVAALAGRRDQPAAVLRALTGRGQLPSEYSVY